MFFKT